LLLAKGWEFLALWHVLETIHSTLRKVWLDLVHHDQVPQDLEQDLTLEHQDLEQDPAVPAVRDLDLVEQNLDSVAVHQAEDSQVGDLLVVAVAASAEEQLERLVKAALAVAVKLASPSGPREKNLSKEVFQALVAQLCHAAMEPQLFVCAAEHRFKTSQTRLTPMPGS
jgi:hypothetical protein